MTGKLLVLERQRAPFTVEYRERDGTWQGGGARLALRIDRIDRVAGEGVLLDYNSGAKTGIELQDGHLRPLQLGLYAAALAQVGQDVSAAALLTLHPARPEFAGVVARDGLLPGRLHA